MQIDLRHHFRSDFPSFIREADLANQRMEDRIRRDELELPDHAPQTIPKYVPEKRHPVNPLKVLTMFLP